MKRKTVLIIGVCLAVAFAVTAVFAVNAIRKMNYPREYQETVSKYSSEFNVPEPLIFAVIKAESGFDPNAQSPAGAMGLMQLMPSTFSWVAGLCGDKEPVGSITEVDANIKYGTYYLSYLYEKFGNWETAVAAYNAGHGRVASWLGDTRYSENGTDLTSIPIEETDNYVNRVFGYYENYKELYYKGE